LKGILRFIFKYRTIFKHLLLIPLFFYLGYVLTHWVVLNKVVDAWVGLTPCEKDTLNYKKLWIQTLIGLCAPMFVYIGFKFHFAIMNKVLTLDVVLKQLSSNLFKDNNVIFSVLKVIGKILYYCISNPINLMTVTGAALGGMFTYQGLNIGSSYFSGLIFPAIILMLVFSVEITLKEDVPKSTRKKLTYSRNISFLVALSCWLFTTFYYKWEPFLKAGWNFLSSI